MKKTPKEVIKITLAFKNYMLELGIDEIQFAKQEFETWLKDNNIKLDNGAKRLVANLYLVESGKSFAQPLKK